MSSFDTPSAIIGLELEGKGFDDVARKAKEQLGTWENIERTVGRTGQLLGGMARTIGGIAAGFAVGSVLNDFMKLEDVASRAALAVGAVGGPKTYGPYRDALRQAGMATSVDATQLGAAAGSIVGQLGASGMHSPRAWGGLGYALGSYSRSYGIDVGTLGQQATMLGRYQQLGPGNTIGLLGQIAAQAHATGSDAQVAQWVQAITSATSMVGSSHPAYATAGTSGSLGALYGAVSSVNPVFQDPGMFAAGVSGVDSTLSQAYRNPRMQAALQMAGVGYWQQRGGLAGPHGADMAKKVLDYSKRQYGNGSIEQDLFLRSNFGDVSADMLKAFSKGQVTYDQLQGVQDNPQQWNEIQRRSKANQDTPSARLNRIQQSGADKIDGPLAGILHLLGIDSIGGALTALGIGYGGKKLLGKGAGKLFGKLKGRAGGAAADAITADAAAGAESAAAEELGATAGGARFGPIGAVVGAAIGVLTSKGNLADEDRININRRSLILARKFGPHWVSSQAARDYAVKNFDLHNPNNRNSAKIWGQIFDMGGTMPTGSPGAAAAAAGAGDPTAGGAAPTAGKSAADKLSEAADKLSKSADRLDRATRKGGSAKDASFDPQGVGGEASSQLGATMILNRSLNSGGGGLASTESTLVSYPGGDGGAGGSGSGGGGGGGGGGGWKACTLTWYDPALGGINSSHGQADPHSKMANGQPYDASALTCAAPKGYAFGTKIEFKFAKKTVTCTVTDRGGAITGSHFDLSRAAANRVGLISAGRGSGYFRVSGGSSSSSSGSGKRSTSTNPDARTSSADSAWLAGAGAAATATASSLGGGRGGVDVHIDGRKVEAIKRLVRS